MFTSSSRYIKSDSGRCEENPQLLVIQGSLCYILTHLEDENAWSVHIYCTWFGIILIFKLRRRIRLTPRCSLHNFQMTSHPCNKYEQIMLSYLLSVKSTPAACCYVTGTSCEIRLNLTFSWHNDQISQSTNAYRENTFAQEKLTSNILLNSVLHQLYLSFLSKGGGLNRTPIGYP